MDKTFLDNIKEKQLVKAENQFKESIRAKISKKLALEKSELIKGINDTTISDDSVFDIKRK